LGSFLDRLGRSVKNLVDLVSKLHKQRVQFKSLTDAIDTCTANIWPRWGRSASEGRKTASTNDKSTRIPLRLGKSCSYIAEKKPKLSVATKSVTCADPP
jgi:hypothetical protein